MPGAPIPIPIRQSPCAVAPASLPPTHRPRFRLPSNRAPASPPPSSRAPVDRHRNRPRFQKFQQCRLPQCTPRLRQQRRHPPTPDSGCRRRPQTAPHSLS
nr:hypothetical protein Iba_chr02bCG12820 [Ipomoea batatas]